MATLEDMAAQLAAVLQVQGNKGRSEWSQLHGKLAEVAAAVGGDDPRTAIQALQKVAKDASSSLALMRALQERVTKSNLKYIVYLVARELSMTPLGDSEPVHMIDEHSRFCKESVDRIIKCSAELSAPDAPYAVVSIVGAQSSETLTWVCPLVYLIFQNEEFGIDDLNFCIRITGKSFLLNHLFGTRFPEMDNRRRRSQTTRGIMISRCIAPSLVLMDVEGFDGREKGQDKLFEKQAALFALTVSDLMMVNMLETDIGREEGGATSLFRIIFQERPKLKMGITKLLVVLRRCDVETSLEIMRSDVLESLEKIWGSVNESVKFKDYIEVDIVGLQDKHSPEFPKQVTALRNLLSNNRNSKVPASGFSLSSSMFWDTIKENKSLDILSHQAALAKLHCRELVEEILQSLKSQEMYRRLISENYPERFKEISLEMLGKIITQFDLNTRRYDSNARENERRHLLEKLHETVKVVSRELIWKVKANTLEQFKRDFSAKNIENMKQANDDLSKYVEEFMSSCGDEKVFDLDHLGKVCGELKEQLQSYAALAIKEKRAKQSHKRTLKRVIKGGKIALGVVGLMTGVNFF
ncbi:unnamed protein product [Alopecurus aequalis]